MHKRFEELLDDILGAAIWDTGKGIGRLILWLILTVIAAAGGGAALRAGQEKLAIFLSGVVALLVIQLILVLLGASWRRRSMPGTSPLSLTGGSGVLGSMATPPATPPATTPPEAPAPAVVREPPVPASDIEWLRAGYGPWEECIGVAIDFLGYLCRLTGLWAGDREKNDLIVELFEPSLDTRRRTKKDFDDALAPGRDVSKAEYADLKKQLYTLIAYDYFELTKEIRRIGTILMGEKLYRGEEYASLYGRHQKAVEALDRFRATETFAHIAEKVRNCAQWLPAPQKRDPHALLEESPLDLRLMQAWEGRDVVIGRRWFGPLIVERLLPPGKDGERPKFVCIRPGDDESRGRFYVYPDDDMNFEKLVTVPMELTIGGCIADTLNEGDRARVILSPAEVINPSDLYQPRPFVPK